MLANSCGLSIVIAATAAGCPPPPPPTPRTPFPNPCPPPSEALRTTTGVAPAPAVSPFQCVVSNDLFGDLGVTFNEDHEPILKCVP
jgi:hypothetical protein